MDKKMKFTCHMKFKDENLPGMKQIEPTESLAISTINHWSKQFAGISSLWFFNPEGDKICFDSMGNYVFTIPSESCRVLGLAA